MLAANGLALCEWLGRQEIKSCLAAYVPLLTERGMLNLSHLISATLSAHSFFSMPCSQHVVTEILKSCLSTASVSLSTIAASYAWTY